MPHPPSDAAEAAATANAPDRTTAERGEFGLPSPRARVARRALIAAIVLGILADPLLRNGPWGLGLLAWIAAFAAGVLIVSRRSGRALSREGVAWLAIAVLAAGGLSWHDADLLTFFDVLAMLTALTLLAMSLDAIPVGGIAAARVRDLMEAAFGTGLGVATGAVPLVARDAEFHAAERAPDGGKARRIGRATLIALPIVVVFALLLANADPIFGSFLTLPDIRIDVLLSHVF
ncbi:MAG TPA: DUF4153 domain-containing protein, partial [Gemmatimonadaceae bacterium]